MVLSLKSNREARGSEVRLETQLLYGHTESSSCSAPNSETRTSCLFHKGSSISFLFVTLPPSTNDSRLLHGRSSVFFSIAPSASMQPDSQILSTPISTRSSFSSYITKLRFKEHIKKNKQEGKQIIIEVKPQAEVYSNTKAYFRKHFACSSASQEDVFFFFF